MGWGGRHLTEHMGSGSAGSHPEPYLPWECSKEDNWGKLEPALIFVIRLHPGCGGGGAGEKGWSGGEVGKKRV